MVQKKATSYVKSTMSSMNCIEIIVNHYELQNWDTVSQVFSNQYSKLRFISLIILGDTPKTVSYIKFQAITIAKIEPFFSQWCGQY